MSEKFDNTFKICVVGDSGIGKEKFVESFVFSDILRDESQTLGVDFYAEIITIETKSGPKRCKIHLWNFTGEERFKFLVSKYCEGANGIMLFFDLANRESFLHLTDWMVVISEGIKKEIGLWHRAGGKKEIPILVIGNKSELKHYSVSPKEIDQFIRKHNLYYIETSTLSKEGISDSFYSIASLIIGVDIHSEYFLSKDIIYRPNITPVAVTTSSPTLTAEDLSNLSQKAIFQKLDILEKKIDGFKSQETAILKQMELQERKLKLKEKELLIKETQLVESSFVKDLGSLEKKVLVFVSYATKDADLFKIKEFAQILTSYKKIDDVLYWEEDMKDNIIKYMSDNLDKCDLMLLFCSPHALKSKAIEKEWTSADIMNKPIIPVFIKLKHIPPLLKSRLGVEFDTFDLQKTIDEVYNLILKKMEKRIIDIKDLKTDF